MGIKIAYSAVVLLTILGIVFAIVSPVPLTIVLAVFNVFMLGICTALVYS